MLAHETLCGAWRALSVARIEINYRLGRPERETAELVQRI